MRDITGRAVNGCSSCLDSELDIDLHDEHMASASSEDEDEEMDCAPREEESRDDGKQHREQEKGPQKEGEMTCH
jgi:hypothetical protein